MNHIPLKNSDTLRDEVLQTIEHDQVKMRPKWKFVMHTTLFFIGLIMVTLTVLYVASFLIFVLHQNGVWFTPYFGWRGLLIFITSIPWFLCGITLIFLVVLQTMMRRYAFSYARPLLYSALVIIVITTTGSMVISNTSFHQQIFDQTEDKFLFAKPLYVHFNQPIEKVLVGRITQITSTEYMIEDVRGRIFTIHTTQKTRFMNNKLFLEGDMIVIIGEKINSSTLEAEGIMKPDHPPTSKHKKPLSNKYPPQQTE